MIIPTGRWVAIDVETHDPELKTLGTGAFRGIGKLLGIALANRDEAAYYGVAHNGGNVANPPLFLRELAAEAAVWEGVLVGHNLRYDLAWLYSAGVKFPKAVYYDTRTIDQIISPRENRFSLKACAARHGAGQKTEPDYPIEKLASAPAQAAAEYAKNDARITYDIAQKQQQLAAFNKAKPAIELDAKVMKVLFYTSARGIAIDREHLLTYIDKQLIVKENQLAAAGVKKVAGKAMPELFGRLGLAPKMKTPGGADSYSEESISEYKHIPEVAALLKARHASSVLAYAKGLYDSMTRGGRVHPTYKQEGGASEAGDEGGARFGRISCKEPNIQQSPSDADYRGIFIPDNHAWVSADFSQQEPRQCIALAYMANAEGAEPLRDQYINAPDTDIYSWMEQSAGVSRKQAKVLFLGAMYGMGVGRLCAGLGIGLDEGQALIKQFSTRYAFLENTKHKIKRALETTDTLYTNLGRPYIFGEEEGQTFGYKALNRLIQGNSSEQTKIAIVELARAGFDIITTMHDENCIDAAVESIPDIVKAMAKPCRRMDEILPAKIDISYGKNWGEAL